MSVGSVSVIVVSHGTRDLTLSAVRSSLACPQVIEAIVVDNASRDGTAQALADLGDERLSVLANESNVGFGRAANQGAATAAGSVLLFLNSDAELNESAVSAVLAEIERWGGRVTAGPRLVGPDGVLQRSAGVLPGLFDLTVRALGLHSVARRAALVPWVGALVNRTVTAREYASAGTATDTIDTTMVSGACFAMGREAFWELGGFDERLFMYFEDADLCKRAAAAGMPIRYVPSAVVTHIGGASSEGDYHFSPMHARSMRQYLQKWWGSPGAALAILLLWLRLIGHALVLHPGTGKAFAALRAALRP